MRRTALLCSAIVLAACVKSENSTVPPDTGMAAAPAPAPAAPAPISLSSVAGKYNVTNKYEGTDSTILTYELNATGDTTGWTITFPNRKPIPMHIVSVSGDSIVAEAGPFESAIRKGVQVKVNTVYRDVNGKLVGRTVAHYSVKGPDSMRVIVSEATKK